MGMDIGLLAVSLVALFSGAEGLVRGSASLAIRLGVGSLVVGLTVVAFGTSSPELLVSASASINGQSAIAVGNAIGSNIFNIGIILGLTSVIWPIRIHFSVIKWDAPVMVFIALIGVGLCLMGSIPRFSGFLLLVGLILYTVINVLLARKESLAEPIAGVGDRIGVRRRPVYCDLLFIFGGLALLLVGSRLLVTSASEIARALKMSEAVIGLTIVAAGTGMPEIATSLMAAFRKESDIAVGNVVGSNIFNILGIFGLGALLKPMETSGITATDLVVMVLFSVALLPLLWTNRQLQRWEGALLLLGYGAYLVILL